MITTFTSDELVQLRSSASEAARVPANLPEGWSISRVDPLTVLAVFEPLSMKPGYVLLAYQFYYGGNGNGFVWAMPVESEFPHPEECCRRAMALLDPPKPLAALDDHMDAIDGDGTPWSYMCASIMARELAEFGAVWHGCDWVTHRIVDADPREDVQRSRKSDLREPRTQAAEWEWLQPEPTDWRPQVVEDRDDVVVTFLTFSGLGRETIYRHTDVYPVGSYKFVADTQEIAQGAGGFVF